MQSIVSEAGLALGTVYKLFAGKLALYQAIHEDRLRDLFAVAAGSLDAAADPRRMLLDGTRAFVRCMADHRTYLELNLREGYSWAVPTRYASASRVEVWERGTALVAAIFQQGIAAGSLGAGDPETQARLLSAMQQVYITRWADAAGALDLDVVLDELEPQIARSFFTTPIEEESRHG